MTEETLSLKNSIITIYSIAILGIIYTLYLL